MTLPSASVLVVLLAFLAPAGEAVARDKVGRPDRAKPDAKRDPKAAASGCKEPAPADPQLVEGLNAYAAGRWADAATTLGTWAAGPDAEKDPAAARGMYALAYALRASRGAAQADPVVARARPLLESRTASAPTLEGWYYLQGLHQMRQDEPARLTAVAAALKAVDAGEICVTRDGDDWFRISRLQDSAGYADQAAESLRSAAEAFSRAPEGVNPSPYRAMTERELGEAAFASNDLATAEAHLSVAARLDPSTPGIHRKLGLVQLRRGNVEAAMRTWRSNWRREPGGNEFMYAVPVMNKVLQYQKRQDMAPMTGLSQFTVPALEQNAISEAKTVYTLQQEQAQAQEAGTPFPPEKTAQMEAAEYASLQYLLELVSREQNLQDFALQNGLLPLIHSRGLPALN